jgi:hypothetical protein
LGLDTDYLTLWFLGSIYLAQNPFALSLSFESVAPIVTWRICPPAHPYSVVTHSCDTNNGLSANAYSRRTTTAGLCGRHVQLTGDLGCCCSIRPWRYNDSRALIRLFRLGAKSISAAPAQMACQKNDLPKSYQYARSPIIHMLAHKLLMAMVATSQRTIWNFLSIGSTLTNA